MLTVVTAVAIGRSCSAGNTADAESGAKVVLVGEYSIIEPGIRVAILNNIVRFSPHNAHALILM